LARHRQSFPGYCFSELIDLFCLADGKVSQLVKKSNCLASTIQIDIMIFLNTDCTNDNTKTTNGKQLVINDCCNFNETYYIINPCVGCKLMRSSLQFIATILLLTFLTECSDPKFSDRNIQAQAEKITSLLDSNSIQIFHKWNYGVRGNYEIWSRLSGDSSKYTCFYYTKKDTSYLRIFQPYNFTKDFSCGLLFDTSKFWQFNFDMYQDKIFRLTFVDNQGQDHITDTVIPVKKFFTNANPFDTLKNLSKLKDDLAVYGIIYRKYIGEFVEFWLSSQDKLTYLPDNLNLDPKFQKFWLDDFSQGTTIKKNWNLHKYKEQKDGG